MFTSVLILAVLFYALCVLFGAQLLVGLMLLAVLGGCGGEGKSTPARAPQMGIAILLGSDDIPCAEATDIVSDAARIYASQTDISLRVVSCSAGNPSTDESAEYLLSALINYRASNPADVVVLFTTRDIFSGDAHFRGYSTRGPACNGNASSIVRVLRDGYDGRTLAHELAHTLGVEHDMVSGYLMYPTTLGESDTMSPDTLGVIRGDILDCML